MGDRSAKLPFLICLYLTCFTSSLAPAIVGSPEDNYGKGQPEIQQDLDNIPHMPVLMKGPKFPPGDGRGYPMLLTHKTSTLLSEALHMLNRVKNLKERRWVEAFIHGLGTLTAALEESANRNIVPHSKLDTLAPPGYQLQPTSPAVPVFAVLSSKMNKFVPKYPVTSPQMNDVLPKSEMARIHHGVTKPGLISQKLGQMEDELVWQLKEQAKNHHTKVTSPNNFDIHQEKSPERSTNSPTVTSPITPAKNTHVDNKVVDMKKEKAIVMEKLFEEMAQLKRLGGTEEEIVNKLRLDNHNFADFTNPNFILAQHHNSDEEANEFEIEEDDQEEEEETAQGIGDLKKDEMMIYRANTASWNPGMEPIHRFPHNKQKISLIPQSQIQRSHINGHLLLSKHRFINQLSPSENLPHKNFDEKPNGHDESNHVHSGYHNFLPRNRIIPNLKTQQTDQQRFQSPQSMSSRQLGSNAQLEDNHPNAPPVPQHYPSRQRYTNYPRQDHNSTFQQNLQMVLPNYQSKYHPSPHTDTKLSDEMERQLRAGKIIVLSDSLVRTNFGHSGKDKAQDDKENLLSHSRSTEDTINATQKTN